MVLNGDKRNWRPDGYGNPKQVLEAFLASNSNNGENRTNGDHEEKDRIRKKNGC